MTVDSCERSPWPGSMWRRRRADPPLPPIVLDRPALLLHLQPPPYRPAFVHAGLILGDVTLVPEVDHLLPGLQPIGSEPPHREDHSRPAKTPPAGRGDHAAAARLASGS
jgi:hypothetical protein